MKCIAILAHKNWSLTFSWAVLYVRQGRLLDTRREFASIRGTSPSRSTAMAALHTAEHREARHSALARLRRNAFCVWIGSALGLPHRLPRASEKSRAFVLPRILHNHDGGARCCYARIVLQVVVLSASLHANSDMQIAICEHRRPPKRTPCMQFRIFQKGSRARPTCLALARHGYAPRCVHAHVSAKLLDARNHTSTFSHNAGCDARGYDVRWLLSCC